MNNFLGVFNSSPVGMFVLDGNASIILINNSALTFLEAKREDIIGKRFGEGLGCISSRECELGCGFGSDCPECDFRKAILSALESGKTTTDLECSKTFFDRGKEIELWFKVSATPVIVDGKRNVVVSLLDITGSKRKEASDKDIYFFENSATLMWRSGLDKKCNYFNKKWLDFTGRELEKEIGDGWAEGVHRDDLERCLQTYFEAFEQRITFEMEYRLCRRDGEYRWVLDTGCPFYDAKGEFAGYIGSVFDITERKMMELELAQDKDFYFSLFENFPAMIWHSDANFNNDYYNKEWLAFTGRTLLEEINTPWSEKLHEQDVEACRKVWFEKSRQYEPFEMEFRVRRYDGEYRWIKDRCGPIFDFQGNFKGYIGLSVDITDRKIAEHGLFMYEALSQKARDIMLFVDLEGDILEANDAAAKAYGYTREELSSLNINNLRKDGDLTRQQIQAANNEGICFETIHIRKDGTTFPVEVNSTGTNIGEKRVLISIIRDITERKKTENQVRESREKYQTLLMNINSAFAYFMVAFDDKNRLTDCTYIEVNKVFEELIGVKSTDLINKSVFEVSTQSSKYIDIFMEKLQLVVLHGECYEVDEIFFEDIEKWCSVYAYSPEKGFLALILTDITEKKKAAEAIVNAKEAAEAATRMKSEFLANMSHEIRTPLNGVVGMIDLTLATGLSDLQKENLKIAKGCANSLLTILNDILDFSRLEAGKLVIDNSNFDIKELVEDIVKAHHPKAVEKRLELNYMFSSLIPEFLYGDPNRLRQILNNLINNAIKFTEEGNVTVVIKGVRIDGENVELKFFVSDTGIGIGADEMGKLFRSFSQIDGSHTRKYGGSGLGLAITKQLVELMGGTIRVESEKNIGSTFAFTIRFKIGKQIFSQDKEPEKADLQCEKLRILLAEDDKVNQTVIKSILMEHGHSIDVASNGIEALELFEKNVYDVILMDIQMPDMDGIQVTRHIRAKEGSAGHTPVIAITAYALQGDRGRFLSKGMDDYVSKPIDREKFLSVLKNTYMKASAKDIDINGVRIGENGSIIFVEDVKYSLDEEKLTIISEISEGVHQLADVLDKGNLYAIEILAGRIKGLANQIEADELKNSAFRIELAARRGNLKEALENSKQILYEFELFKKAIS